MLVFLLAAALVGAVAAIVALRATARRREGEALIASRAEAAALVRSAQIEAAAARRHEETAAREESLERRAAAEAEISAAERRLADKSESLIKGEAAVAGRVDDLEARRVELDAREAAVQALRDRAEGLRRDAQRRLSELRTDLEGRAGTSGDAIKHEMVQRWLEATRAGAAQKIRLVEQSLGDPSYDREARRVMDIACGRYQNHFLTERNVSNLRVGTEVCAALTADDGRLHAALAEVANVQLLISDAADAVRLDGLDGVGREVARRALTRLMKKPGSVEEARREPVAWATRIRQQLDQEIKNLGKKAFQVLEIPRAHPEIVELVGALNYRTSYTQNQWLHAVEASFLCGMMASEMGLDIKVARRATLMHDIGKALTHKIEGSHAVIGADIARRLGETEIVANAIGAHHADEPPSSVYAYLVAAADAMSGARPGARREMAEGFSNKVEELERIGLQYRGVDRAHAVHGGRELRVYVREDEVTDLATVELSQEIAHQIAEEMTFPGQIKVTVIRSYEAVATAN